MLSFRRFAALLAVAAQGILATLGLAQHSVDVAPVEQVLSIEATSPIAEESSFPHRRLPLRGRFTISRTGSTEKELPLPVFVHYGGTASPGLDYPFLPWLVTIPAGTNRFEIEVAPNPDDAIEPLETVEATLSDCPPPTDPPMAIACYLVNIDPAHASARVFIRDDGTTTASLEITAPKDKAEFEKGAPIDLRATAIDLSGAITHVAFFDGDKQIGESTVNFFREPDPGTPVLHQFEWKGAAAGLHTITARATDAGGNPVSSAPVRVTVGTDLPLVSIEATWPETVEPSPLSRIRPAMFTFRRTGDTSRPLQVWAQYSGSATSGADYQELPTVVEFPADATSVEVSVFAINDKLIEDDETVIGEVTHPLATFAATYRIDPHHNIAKVVIHDNGLAAASLEITAPKDGTEFTEGSPILINATAIDPAGAIAHVTFFDGEKQIGESTVNFFREPDPGSPVFHEFEWQGAAAGPHTLTVRAISAAGETITSPPVHITVAGGGPPLVNIVATLAHTSEPCPVCRIVPGVFTVSRTGPTDKGLLVFLTTHGSATPGDDYEPLPNAVEIPAGSKSVELTIAPKDDQLAEGDETVIATLQPDPSMGPIERYLVDSEHREATVTIRDDDAAVGTVVTIRAIDPFAREGANPVDTATFEVRREGETDSSLTVRLAFAGNAVNGVDYETLPNEVTIPAGRRSARIVVTPIEDKALEGIETVVIELVDTPVPFPWPPVGAAFIHHPASAAAIIVDNDVPRPPCLRLPDGVFNLCVPADPAHCYRVETSPDLHEWTPHGSIPASDGVAQFVDADATSLTHRFYRLVPVPCDPE